MIATFLLALAAASGSQSVVDNERAYAANAQRIGQWSAFREAAANGAVMFAPGPVDAVQWLEGRANPPVAVKWQPAQAFVSCDGATAATTGPWQGPARTGYFTTIWSRSGGDWRWNVDFGDALKTPLPAPPEKVPVRRASCRAANPKLLPAPAAAKKSGSGSSADKSLEWIWRAEDDGSRELLVYLWTGSRYEAVLDRKVSV